MFHRFWPELIEMGILHRFNTPLSKITYGKKVLNFYDKSSCDVWLKEHEGEKFSMKYLKGLGSSDAKSFREYFDDMQRHLVQIVAPTQEDFDIIQLVFGKENGAADKRKEWLSLMVKN